MTAPTFEISSEKFALLNCMQAINKVVEVKLGKGGYVRYDVYMALIPVYAGLLPSAAGEIVAPQKVWHRPN